MRKMIATVDLPAEPGDGVIVTLPPGSIPLTPALDEHGRPVILIEVSADEEPAEELTFVTLLPHLVYVDKRPKRFLGTVGRLCVFEVLPHLPD